MKKFGWKLSLLVVLAGLVFIWLIRAPLLSAYATDKMGIRVSMRWIGLWPSHTNIHDFSIKNPPGFKKEAFKAEKVICTYSLKELFGNPTVIDRIEIDESTLTIDFKEQLGTANNWTALAAVMKTQKHDSHVIIKKLILTNLNIELKGTPLFVKPNQTHFDRLEFDNIDSNRGFPTGQLIKLIFQNSGIGQYIEDLFNPEEDVEKILSPLKIFGG